MQSAYRYKLPLLSALFIFYLYLYAYDVSQTSTVSIALSETTPTPKDPIAGLGKKIFFDTRFSRDQSISCASCHQPDLAFTDGKARAEGLDGQTGTRNTPSLLNATYTQDKFWDGRRPSLTAQVLDPFTNPIEHGLTDKTELVQRFQSSEDYTRLFTLAFSKKLVQATLEDIALGLSAYIRFLKPAEIRLQRYLSRQDKSALTEAEQHGLELFRGRANCTQCHTLDNSTTFTDGSYHSRAIGLSRISPRLANLLKTVSTMSREAREQAVSTNPDIAALGRFVVTLQPSDIGKFKTPSLREVAVTAPYMHDGSLATLEQAVDWELYYLGQDNQHVMVLSQAERSNLLAFLRALTSTHN